MAESSSTVISKPRPITQFLPQPHGTAKNYWRGCRCEKCKEAGSAYAVTRKKQREGVISIPSERQLQIRRMKSTRRRERALELARQHGSVSLGMLARDLALSPSTLLPIMRALVAEGLLQAAGKTRLRTYVIRR